MRLALDKSKLHALNEVFEHHSHSDGVFNDVKLHSKTLHLTGLWSCLVLQHSLASTWRNVVHLSYGDIPRNLSAVARVCWHESGGYELVTTQDHCSCIFISPISTMNCGGEWQVFEYSSGSSVIDAEGREGELESLPRKRVTRPTSTR